MNNSPADVAHPSVEIAPTASEQPKEEIPKTESKAVLIGAIIILCVFASIFAGFKLYEKYAGPNIIDIDSLHQDNLAGDLNEKEGYIYNGFSFVYADGLWWTEVTANQRLIKIPLRFGPRDVENITISGNIDPKLFNAGPMVYLALNDPLTLNKYYALGIMELQTNMLQGIGRVPIGACAVNNSDCGNLTIINCKTSQGQPIIELNPTGKAQIVMDKNCIIISGEGEGFLRAVDYIILKWYKVIE